VDFGRNAKNKDIPFFIRAYSDQRSTQNTVEVRLDDKDSEPIASIPVESSKDYINISSSLPKVSGKHTLYLSCNGKVIKNSKKGLMTINWIEYTPQK